MLEKADQKQQLCMKQEKSGKKKKYPTKQNLISVHSMFQSVCVQVRQQGAWKLHPYNS